MLVISSCLKYGLPYALELFIKMKVFNEGPAFLRKIFCSGPGKMMIEKQLLVLPSTLKRFAGHIVWRVHVWVHDCMCHIFGANCYF